MNKYLVSTHSAYDGEGQSIKTHIVDADNENEALMKALRSEGWEVKSMEDLDTISDTSWSKPILL